MATNYDEILRRFAYQMPAGVMSRETNDGGIQYYRLNEDGEQVAYNPQTASQDYDPYDQYLQSLNTGKSFGIPDQELARIQSIADFNGMSLDQWIKAGMGDYGVTEDEFGTPIYTPTSGADVNYGAFPGYNPADTGMMKWMPYIIAAAGAAGLAMPGSMGGLAAEAGVAGGGFGGGAALAETGAGALSATEMATLYELTGLPQFAASAAGGAAGAVTAEEIAAMNAASEATGVTGGLTASEAALPSLTSVPPGSSSIMQKALDYLKNNPGTGISALSSILNAANSPDVDGMYDGQIQGATDEENRKNLLRGQVGSVFDPSNFTADDDAVAKATRDYQAAQLKKRYEDSERQLRFSLANTGNTKGSLDIEGNAKLAEDNRMGGLTIEDTVRKSLGSLNANRENAKMNALNLVNAGAGPEAVASAASQIKAMTDQAAAGNRDDIFNNLFQDTTNLTLQQNAINRRGGLASYADAMRRSKGAGGVATPVNSPNIFNT